MKYLGSNKLSDFETSLSPKYRKSKVWSFYPYLVMIELLPIMSDNSK